MVPLLGVPSCDHPCKHGCAINLGMFGFANTALVNEATPHIIRTKIIVPSKTVTHKSSFIPRTSQLWNSLPPTTFPESYNLSSFKSNVNKLDLVSLST